MNTKIILLLSEKRAGSNYFISLFENFKNVDLDYEIFQEGRQKGFKKEKYLHDLMVRKYGINYKNIMHSKFSEILIYLKKNCNKEYFIFKCFPNHLTSNNIKYLIDNKIIDHTFILERKNIIDRYISYKKALQLENWSKVDTSNIQINFDKSNYKNFKEDHVKTYKTYLNIVENEKYTYFEYNDIVNRNDFLNKIIKILPGLKLNCEIDNLQTWAKKQDNEKNYSKKIKNYNDIKKYLEDELKSLKI